MIRWLKRYHNRRCSRKAGFPTVAIATAEAERMSRKTGELIIAYKCYDCPRWHIGHADQTQLAARNMSGPHLTFCEICGRPIPVDITDEAEPREDVTTCSPRCQKAAQRRRRRASTKPTDTGSEGCVPGSS